MQKKIYIVESAKNFNEEVSGLVMTAETFSKVFSPERIKLLRRIRLNNHESIYQIAKGLKKPYEVVFRNIKYLEGIGIIQIQKDENRKIPMMKNEYTLDLSSAV